MTNLERVLAEAMTLSNDERSELAERLLETLGPVEHVDPEVDAEWREEVRRRRARVASGEAKLVPWEEVRQRLFNR